MLPIVHEAWSLPRMNINFLSRVLSPFELELPVFFEFWSRSSAWTWISIHMDEAFLLKSFFVCKGKNKIPFVCLIK